MGKKKSRFVGRFEIVSPSSSEGSVNDIFKGRKTIQLGRFTLRKNSPKGSKNKSRRKSTRTRRKSSPMAKLLKGNITRQIGRFKFSRKPKIVDRFEIYYNTNADINNNPNVTESYNNLHPNYYLDGKRRRSRR